MPVPLNRRGVGGSNAALSMGKAAPTTGRRKSAFELSVMGLGSSAQLTSAKPETQATHLAVPVEKPAPLPAASQPRNSQQLKSKAVSSANLSSNSANASNSGAATPVTMARTKTQGQLRVDEFVKNKKKAAGIDYSARYIPPGRRMPAPAAPTPETPVKVTIDPEVELQRQLEYSRTQALVAATEFADSIPEATVAPLDPVSAPPGSSQFVLARSKYLQDVAELEKRYQKMNFDEESFVAKLSNPEAAVADYLWTAYSYYHINKQFSLDNITMRILKTILANSAAVSQELKISQARDALARLPKESFTAIKAPIGHLFRISRLTMLNISVNAAHLFANPLLAFESAQPLAQRQFVVTLFLGRICVAEQENVLHFLIDNFDQLFSSNEEAESWRVRMKTLQQSGTAALGYAEGADGWRQILNL